MHHDAENAERTRCAVFDNYNCKIYL